MPNHMRRFIAFGAVALFTSGPFLHAQTTCESCSLSFVPESLETVQMSCSEGDPLQALPNFPAFNTDCTEGYWASIFKYTTGSTSSCTAERSVGLPAALGSFQIGDFTATGLATSNHFDETAEGLTWTVYPENVARLQGTVRNVNNVNAQFEVDFYFTQGTSGAAWTAAGGQVNDVAAGPGDVDGWTIWQIKPHISKLVGEGSLTGHVLYLESSNSVQSYPFQEGNGANGIHNGNGLGGTFAWSTCVGGTIYGGMGTTSHEFTACEESHSICASDNDAMVEFFIGNLLGFDQIQGGVDVTDDTPPTLSDVPVDYTLNCPVDLEELDALNTVTAIDDCSSATLTVDESFVNGACPSEFTRTRTFTATDGCGLTAHHVQVVTVVDEIGPELSVPDNATLSCSETLVYEEATAVDACDGILPVTEGDPVVEEGDCPGEYTVHRTFSTSDLCGNTTTGAQTIQVRDLTPPVLNLPDDVILPCGSSFVYPPATATDNCTAEEDIDIAIFNSLPPTSCPQEYILERRFMATDLCGNTVLEIQTVTVTDNDLPYFTFVPEDQTLSCDEAPVYEEAVAADDCSSFEVSESVDTTFLGCASNYDIVRTFTVTDACGNMADAMQTIAVRDLTAPVISSTVDQPVLECDDEWIPPTLDASDNCSDVVWNMTTETVGDPSAGAYVLNVLHIASDACGNTASIAQTVEFVDTTSPTFTTVPSDLVLSCEEEVPLNLAVAEDNCSSVTLEVVDDLELEVGPSEHLLTRTFIATDAQGNTSSAVQLISIVDDTAPEFTFVPANYSVECSDEIPMDDATASDNCGEVTIEVSSETTAGDAAGNYVIVRTFTATDDAGNSTSATQTITVQDTTAPEFIFVPADYTVECSEEMPMDDAMASDNCGEVTIEVSSETTAVSAGTKVNSGAVVS